MLLYSVLFCLVLTFNFPFSLLSQNSTPTLWDSLEEPDIRDTSEFEYLFSKDIPQQKKKPLSETYEKKNKVKKVLPGCSNHNYVTVFCPAWGFIVCCWFAFALFSKKMFWKVLSHRWHQGANSLRNLYLLFWSYCLNFQTVFLIWTFFQPLILLEKKKANLVKSGL